VPSPLSYQVDSTECLYEAAYDITMVYFADTFRITHLNSVFIDNNLVLTIYITHPANILLELFDIGGRRITKRYFEGLKCENTLHWNLADEGLTNGGICIMRISSESKIYYFKIVLLGN